MGRGVVWVPKLAQVMEVPRFNDEGGYVEIHKVCIPKKTNIPIIVDFIEKKLKAAIEKDSRLKQLVEALACLILHPGMIKFWAIHSRIVVGW